LSADSQQIDAQEPWVTRRATKLAPTFVVLIMLGVTRLARSVLMVLSGWFVLLVPVRRTHFSTLDLLGSLGP
jgi:ABC-type transport system involved in cytochrome bd biosynthesis fused ATPase/permease subunit